MSAVPTLGFGSFGSIASVVLLGFGDTDVPDVAGTTSIPTLGFAPLGTMTNVVLLGFTIGEPDPTPAVCGTDVLSVGMAFLARQLQAHASQPVIYHYGTTRIALCATFGRTMLRLSDEMGATRIEWTDRDFIIPAASLVVSGSKVLPKRGNRIVVNDGVNIHTYEVLPYGNEPHWKWCDPFRTMLRIHTKRITTEPI